MKARILRALGTALIVHAAASCGSRVAAQDPEDCEPVTAASVSRVAERLSLTLAQTEWLRNRRRAGRLEDPSDLRDLPDADAGLLENLAGAFCWGRNWEGEARVSSRHRRGAEQGEIQAALEGNGVRFRGRSRRETDAGLQARGSVVVRRSGWEVLLGHLRCRRGLGLLLATPGAEIRGNAALGLASSGWGASVSMDPELSRGILFGHDAPDGAWRLGGIQGGGKHPSWWGTGEWVRNNEHGAYGGAVLVGPGGPAGSLWIEAAETGGGWCAEWAWGVSGSAQGAAWRFLSKRFGFRAGAARRSASFHVPALRAIRAPRSDETLGLQTEVRWRPGTGRFLIFRFEDGRSPDRPWIRFRTVREVAWGERVAAGLALGLLWRSIAVETQDPREEEGRLRGDLTYRRSSWRLGFRIEERISATGRVRFRSFRVGSRGRISWELRADVLSQSGEGPRVWSYRRRAGGVYGWDVRGPGTWIGGWTSFSWKRFALELSADAGASGWDWIGAMQVPIGKP